MLQTSWGYKGDIKDGPASHDTCENQLYPIDISGVIIDMQHWGKGE